MALKTLVILAQGFEEIEAITVIDVLRRAGIAVTVASLADRSVQGSHAITVVADKTLAEATDDFDCLVLPGGGTGSKNLAASNAVNHLVKTMAGEGKIVAAICAAPAVVLSRTGVLNGKAATCFPGEETRFDKTTLFKEDAVVIDGTIITSRAAGTAFAFALAIVEKLAGSAAAHKVRESTLA